MSAEAGFLEGPEGIRLSWRRENGDLIVRADYPPGVTDERREELRDILFMELAAGGMDIYSWIPI
jgi:hypothetical protein